MSTEWGVKLYSNQVDRQPSACMIDARTCVAVCRTRCPAVQRHSWTGTSPRSRRPTCWSGGAASSVPATKTRCTTVRTSSTTAAVCTTRTPASSASESRRRRRRRRRPLLLRRQRRHCRRASVRHATTTTDYYYSDNDDTAAERLYATQRRPVTTTTATTTTLPPRLCTPFTYLLAHSLTRFNRRAGRPAHSPHPCPILHREAEKGTNFPLCSSLLMLDRNS